MTSITAKDLNDWADKRQSHGDLPILIRRLIHSTTGGVSKIDFPGGDSIGLSGKDGVVMVDEGKGNAWVPGGESCWEISCKRECNIKANNDYKTRTKQINPDDRAKMSFVFATPRNWKGRSAEGGRRAKEKWEKDRQTRDGWKNVRVLDAVDLEQWIETSKSVQVWMAEKLNHVSAIPGIHTPEEEWEKWAIVTERKLSTALILTDRDSTVANLIKWLEGAPTHSFRVIADTRGEASAFVCAALMKHEKYAHRLIVVKSSNDDVRKILGIEDILQPIFLFPDEPDAATVIRCKAHIIIADTRKGSNQSGFLRTISRGNFTKALVDMGYSEKNAEQLSRKSGCFVSILRRLLAPADSPIAQPNWAKTKSKKVMIAAALVGQWNQNNKYDLELLEYLAKMDYEEFEMQAAEFLCRDDAPIEKKGDIWLVKSRIDALFGVAEFITPAVLERFWKKTEEIFDIRNPAPDLPQKARTATSRIYEKIPPYNDPLFSSITDTLILLSVYHDRLILCEGIESRVCGLVREIFDKAGKNRWLSLSGILQKFAEAAPEIFLDAVNKMLKSEAHAVDGMFSADSSLISAPIYHTELLQGLEILAWNNKHLPRVIDLLARMVDFKLPGNLASRLENSLLSFFQLKFPQCGADTDERMLRFKQLCEHHPDVAWKICPQILNIQQDDAIHNPIPWWREIPTRAEYEAESSEERAKMFDVVFDNTLLLIDGNADRIIQILDIFTSLSSVKEAVRFIETVKSSMATADEEARARVRDKVSEKIGLCRSWCSSDTPPVNSKWLEKILPMYLDLQKEIQPKDLVLRHRRIFTDSFDQNLEFHENDHQKQQDQLWKNRKEAIHEILKSNEGKDGVIRLAARCNDAWLVGRSVVAKDDKARMLWAHLACQFDMDEFRKTNFMRGIFANVSEWGKFSMSGFTQVNAEKWGEENIVSFALALRPCGKIWDALESSCSEEIQTKYWRRFKYNIVEEGDVPRIVAETARVGCYVMALHYSVVHRFKKINAKQVIRILEGILTLPGNVKNKIDHQFGYQISQALSYSSKKGIEKYVVARLELDFYACLKTVGYKPNVIHFLLANNSDFFIRAIHNISNSDFGHRWQNVLGDWNIPPGMTASGEFDDKKLREWIVEARNLARQSECLKLADTEIGRILAHTPAGKDGICPCEAVRDFLEKEDDVDKIADGLGWSIHSRRRKTFLGDIEEQEHPEAIKYQEIAERLHLHYPRTARVYRKLADQLLHSAQWHDQMIKPRDPE